MSGIDQFFELVLHILPQIETGRIPAILIDRLQKESALAEQ
jgi:hypothetical protein